MEHVTKRYEDKDALSDLNWDLRWWDLWPNRSHFIGKTTTILFDAHHWSCYGEVYVDDMALSQHRDATQKNSQSQIYWPIPSSDCQ